MKNKTKAKILKAPLISLVVISSIAGIYAAFTSLVHWAVPIIHIVILVSYFIGEWIGLKEDKKELEPELLEIPNI